MSVTLDLAQRVANGLNWLLRPEGGESNGARGIESGSTKGKVLLARGEDE